MNDINVRIRQDTREVDYLLAGLGRGAKKVIARALNRTLTPVSRTGFREMASDLRITQKTIKQATRVNRASVNKRVASIEAKGERIPLIAFNANKVNLGVTYRHWQGGRKLITGAFIRTIVRSTSRYQGKSAVLKRRGDKAYPITQLRGASIPYVMLQKRVQNAMQKTAEERWPAAVAQELRYFLRYERRG